MNNLLEAVQPETADVIITQAKAKGLSVDEYLRRLLGLSNGKAKAVDHGTVEFVAALESLAEVNVEPLPRDFSREDIYFPAE